MDTFTTRQTVDELIHLSKSRDGFKRQNAVRRLGKLGDPRAIPCLIERANDWVPEVRESAYQAIRELMTPPNAAAFIANIPILYHLEECRRANHSELIASVETFLSQSANATLLVDSLAASNPLIARLVFRVVEKRRLLPPGDLALNGLAQSSVVVRSMAIDILRTLEGPEFDNVLAKGLTDGFMPVRREAFQQLLHRNRTQGLAVARQFLFDRATAIREIAVKQLTAAGVDVESIYAIAVTDVGKRRVIACILWGWAELRCVNRVDEIKKFVTNAAASLRREAIRALARLIGDGAKPELVTGLTDKAPSVCNEAARLCVKHQVSFSAEELLAIAGSSQTEHALEACCRVASIGNKWEWLLVILGLLGPKTNASSRALLHRQLDTWQSAFNRSASQPSDQTIHRLVSETKRCRDYIDRRALQLLDFTLRSYGA